MIFWKWVGDNIVCGDGAKTVTTIKGQYSQNAMTKKV
jgi:hypothetical protein